MLQFVTQVCYNFYSSYFLYFQLVIKFFKHLLQSNKVFGQKLRGMLGVIARGGANLLKNVYNVSFFSLQVDELTSLPVDGYQLVNLSPCQLVYYHHLLVKQ